MGVPNHNHVPDLDILIFCPPQKVLRGFKLQIGNHNSILKDTLLEEWISTVTLKYHLPLRHLQIHTVFPFKDLLYGKKPSCSKLPLFVMSNLHQTGPFTTPHLEEFCIVSWCAYCKICTSIILKYYQKIYLHSILLFYLGSSKPL